MRPLHRDGMEQKDWLRLVAAHSDAWLVSVAFYYGAKLRQHERCLCAAASHCSCRRQVHADMDPETAGCSSSGR